MVDIRIRIQIIFASVLPHWHSFNHSQTVRFNIPVLLPTTANQAFRVPWPCRGHPLLGSASSISTRRCHRTTAPAPRSHPQTPTLRTTDKTEQNKKAVGDNSSGTAEQFPTSFGLLKARSPLGNEFAGSSKDTTHTRHTRRERERERERERGCVQRRAQHNSAEYERRRPHGLHEHMTPGAVHPPHLVMHQLTPRAPIRLLQPNTVVIKRMDHALGGRQSAHGVGGQSLQHAAICLYHLPQEDSMAHHPRPA